MKELLDVGEQGLKLRHGHFVDIAIDNCRNRTYAIGLEWCCDAGLQADIGDSVEDVAILELLVAGNAMAHDVVDRSADRTG